MPNLVISERTMFTESAELYDLIYSSMKDYAAESESIAKVLRQMHPRCRTILDVACGTGEHARLLAQVHGFEVDGVDLDPRLLAIAGAKHPEGRFHEGDMLTLNLDRRFDAVICMFGSIAYARTLARLRQALTCFREHLSGDGIVLVEPFFTPDGMSDGHTGSRTVEANGTRVTRVNRSKLDGRLCRLYFDYEIEWRAIRGAQRRCTN